MPLLFSFFVSLDVRTFDVILLCPKDDVLIQVWLYWKICCIPGENHRPSISTTTSQWHILSHKVVSSSHFDMSGNQTYNLSGDITTDCISRCKSNYTYTCIINAWKALWNIIYMGKNLLSVPESVTSAIKNKRANIH